MKYFLALNVVLCSFLCGSCQEPQKSLELGIYGLYMPQNKNSQQLFPIPYLDFRYHRLHFFPRYNFDLLRTATFNVCYDMYKNKDWNAFFTPSLGWMAGAIVGPMAGFQASFTKEKIQFYGINQYLFGLDNTRNQTNFYTWSEITYRLSPYFQPGLSAFIRHFTHTNTTFQDYGIEIISEYKKMKATIYLMNPWDNKIYSFIGVSYKF